MVDKYAFKREKSYNKAYKFFIPTINEGFYKKWCTSSHI